MGRLSDDSIRQALIANPAILSSRPSTKRFLSDAVIDKAFVAQLLSVFDSDIIDKIRNTLHKDNLFIGKLYLSMEANTGYTAEISKLVINTWISWINIDVVSAYRVYIERTKNEKEPLKNDPPKFTPNVPSNATLIPCGVGRNDNGFLVFGLNKKAEQSVNGSIFAILYHYLQRSDHIDEIDGIPSFIKRKIRNELLYQPNYQTVYRLMMVVLLMVRHNYLNGQKLSFRYDGNTADLTLAFECINNYLSLFSHIADIHVPMQLQYVQSSNLLVSLTNKSADIYICDYVGTEKARAIWFSPNIIYRLGKEHKAYMEAILSEISPYREFRSGQYEAFCKMMNAQAHSMCIMPTGAGKSLIFYLSAILQPGVTIVVAPTDILIEDQIRNLSETHQFDDVTVLNTSNSKNFIDYRLSNRIIYLTPEIFQNRNLLKEFIYWNQAKYISSIVLDEVHCLSNWSHDFRPDYLMLSKYLNQYLDRTYFKGYTATANYSVMRDLENQLSIKDEYIISPLELNKSNISYTFLACDSYDEMLNAASTKLQKTVRLGQKTLIFTKNDEISRSLAEALPDDIKVNVNVYSSDNPSAYHGFASGDCYVLIASDELGIGINLSDVQNVIHFGLPLSKGEYVQQIGRAGRHGGKASSTVIYLACSDKNINENLLHRSSSTAQIISILASESWANDYTDTFKKLLGENANRSENEALLMKVYLQTRQIKDFSEITYKDCDFNKIKKCYYALYVMSLIQNWCVCDLNTVGVSMERVNRNLPSVKKSFTKYLQLVGNNRKSIYSVGKAISFEEILTAYLNWYYDYFVYYHREQFLDMLAFFENYKSQQRGNDFTKLISEQLSSYFSLQMMEISQDEAKYTNLTYMRITQYVKDEAAYQTQINIERLNQNNYHVKLDWFLFTYGLMKEENFEIERLERVAEHVDEDDIVDLFESASVLYEKAETNDRIAMFEILEEIADEHRIAFQVLFDTIFRNNKRDIVYYGMLIKRLNKVLKGA